MATNRRKERPGLGIFLGALLLTISGGSISHAQDTVGNTPPELRDFRLDPPPPENDPAQEAASPIAEPALPPAAEPTPAPVVRQPSPTVAAPERSAPAPATEVTPDASAEPEIIAPSAEADATSDVAQDDTAMLPQPDQPRPSKTEGMGTTEIAALFTMFVGFAAGAFYLWQKSRPSTSIAASARSQTKRPIPSGPARTPNPRAASPLAPPSVPTPKPSSTPTLSMAFVPENAVVSFNSLTVKGHLHVTNTGMLAADDLSVSVILISASNEQQRAIDHFFANADQHTATPLGLVKPYGNLSLPLELSVPLSQMQTFSVKEKTLLAPILVAKLVRTLPDGIAQEVARLACMIGRETTPPQTKMSPLRLDQGPRSFARLGQRTVHS